MRWRSAGGQRRRGLQQLLTDEEVWASAQPPVELASTLTPIPPLGLELPAAATRQNLAALWADPVWQLARPTLALRDGLPLADGLALHPALAPGGCAASEGCVGSSSRAGTGLPES